MNGDPKLFGEVIFHPKVMIACKKNNWDIFVSQFRKFPQKANIITRAECAAESLHPIPLGSISD